MVVLDVFEDFVTKNQVSASASQGEIFPRATDDVGREGLTIHHPGKLDVQPDWQVRVWRETGKVGTHPTAIHQDGANQAVAGRGFQQIKSALLPCTLNTRRLTAFRGFGQVFWNNERHGLIVPVTRKNP